MLRAQRLALAGTAIVVAVGVACGSRVAPPAAAPEPPVAEVAEAPRAELYGGPPPMAEPDPAEAALWAETVGPNPSCRCTADPRLTLAARGHARELARSDRPGRQTDVDHLRFRLLALGGIDYAVQPLVIRLDRAGRDALAAFVLAHGDSWSHCGLGIGRQADRAIAVWIGVRRTVEVERLPVTAAPGDRIAVRGRLLTERPAPLIAYLGLPGGRVERIEPVTSWSEHSGSRFAFELVLADRGRHDLELLVDTGSGPEIGALLPLFAGVAPDERPTITPEAPTPGDRSAGDRALTALINAARERAGVAPLTRDQRLDRIAADHSREMAARGFFGHHSPTSGVLADRLRAAGVLPERSAENVARSRSIVRVHHNLMRSPSHRINVLDPAFTHLGIGLAWVADDVLATEVFARW